MKIIITAGAPASGKTSILFRTIKYLKGLDIKMAVAKLDCLKSDDQKIYEALNIPVITGLSENLCPDHFLAINIIEIFNWAKEKGADYLIVETAGLCNRCAPFIDRALNICVIDCLSSIKVPEKLGPIVTTADIILISKVDMVSQAEREVFVYNLMGLNPNAKILEANGLSRFGSQKIGNIILNSSDYDTIEGDSLRHSMPSATCSYCVGEIRIGNTYQQGIINKMDFSKGSEFSYV
jgi:Ni2+-binding GTPase involved in maturation of urease and hydrogenase